MQAYRQIGPAHGSSILINWTRTDIRTVLVQRDIDMTLGPLRPFIPWHLGLAQNDHRSCAVKKRDRRHYRALGAVGKALFTTLSSILVCRVDQAATFAALSHLANFEHLPFTITNLDFWPSRVLRRMCSTLSVPCIYG